MERGIRNAFFAAAVLAAGITPALAGWREEASPADINRLVTLDTVRMQAVQAAVDYDGKGDFGAIKRVMEPAGRAVPARALLGDWRCRQIKLGGISPYIVYPTWFHCRVRAVRGGLFFEKLNGSQRTNGFLYPENGAWVYLGASSAGHEPWHRYSGRQASVGARVTPDDQIGLLTGIGANHLKIEIPAVQESLLDVIELKR
jgi:hypothetical protein